MLKEFPVRNKNIRKKTKSKMEKFFIFLFINIVLHNVDNLIHLSVENSA